MLIEPLGASEPRFSLWKVSRRRDEKGSMGRVQERGGGDSIEGRSLNLSLRTVETSVCKACQGYVRSGRRVNHGMGHARKQVIGA